MADETTTTTDAPVAAPVAAPTVAPVTPSTSTVPVYSQDNGSFH